MKISLVGFMGSGKSSFGGQLAQYMKFSFFDTDALIEERTGKKTGDIFETEGEEYFRQCEQAVLNDLLQNDNCVIATGGGLPMYHNNMDKLLKNTYTIFLKPDFDEMFKWLKVEKMSRPLLKNIPDEKLQERIRELYNKRLPFYRKSKLVISPSHMTPEFLAEYLKKSINH